MTQQRINRRSREWFVASVLAFVLVRGGRARWMDVHRHVVRLGHRAHVTCWGKAEADSMIASLVGQDLLIETVNEWGFRVWLSVPDYLDPSRETSSSPK